MKFTRKRPAISRTMLVRSLAIALLATTTAAFASDIGHITAVSVTPNSVFVNENLTITVRVKEVNKGIYCSASIVVVDGSNAVVKSDHHKLQSKEGYFDEPFQFWPATPGVYTVKAFGGTQDSPVVGCTGGAQTSFTVVKAKEISSAPIKLADPSTSRINPVNPIPKINPIPINPGNPGALRKP